MVTTAVTVEHRTDAHVLRLDGGENLFDDAFLTAMHGALDEIAAAETTLPVVTVGTGKYFSNGFDLAFLGSLQGDTLLAFVDRACALLARVLTFGAPTVAAINGHAFGIGAMLAVAHDQRVMRADRGWFCLPEVDLGLPFRPFMQALLTTRLSPATAAEAMLSGRRYDGAAAVAAGIANASATEAELLPAAIEQARPWSGKRPDVLHALKTQLYESVTAALDGGTDA